MNHKRLISLTACLILATVPGISPLILADIASETDAKAQLHCEKANELRKAADYDGAITEYKKVIALSPHSKIAQDAHYWIGQSHFEARQFDAAHSAFQTLLDEYPASLIIPSTKQMIERVQQAKKNRALFEAVKKADVEQVRLLIAEGADVDSKWGDVYSKNEENPWPKDTERTALRYAVKAGIFEVVKHLVEAGADVNAGQWPPLCQAVDENNTAIAEYLIAHGANVNAPEGWTALQEAPYINNNIEMVELLITSGADINAGSFTALHGAVCKDRHDLVKLLISKHANVNARDKWGYTPLGYAASRGKIETLQSLVEEKADVNYKDPEGDTALHNAAMKGKIDAVKLLLEAGANIDTRNERGQTALHSAAERGRTDAVKLLLEAGANINARNDKGQTALHIPLDVKSSNYSKYPLSKDTLELLLAKGTDVNLKDKDGRTPLHLAAESADADIVALLLDKGAKINAKDDEFGFTALHHAVRLGKKNMAELLIARGADINAKDKEGHTPLYVAVNHDYQFAELLINKGADTGIQTESGQTLLELAQQRKQLESTVPDMIFDGDPNSVFGIPIVCGDVDGDEYDDILIGAHQYNNKRGRVTLFYGGPDMDATADLIFEGQNEGDRFGTGIVCGDIDHDGYEDIVIAAGSYSENRENRGRAYLYWGSDRHSMDTDPDKIFVGEQEKNAQFGSGHPAVHDIDNDGYDDIILGAARGGGDKTGRAYLYYGNTKELMDTSHDLIFTGENRMHQFGATISCGDVDSDGYGDIVIGPLYPKQCRAYLYYGGSKSNMDAKADVVFKAQSEGKDYFGRGIVFFDQNRDGYDDVLIGAPGYKNNQGRAYLYHGNAKRNLDVDPDIIFDGEGEGSSYGNKVVCGDIDGDNVNDLIIGAPGSGQRVGRGYVYWGKELAGPDPTPGRILTAENPKDEFGYGLACGDVNNDGFDDLVVGAYGYKDKAGANQGRAYLYYGGPKSP